MSPQIRHSYYICVSHASSQCGPGTGPATKMSPVLWWRNLRWGQCLWLVTWLQLQCYDDYRLVVAVVTAEVLQK